MRQALRRFFCWLFWGHYLERIRVDVSKCRRCGAIVRHYLTPRGRET